MLMNMVAFRRGNLFSTPKIFVMVLHFVPNQRHFVLQTFPAHAIAVVAPVLQGIAHCMPKNSTTEKDMHSILANVEMGNTRNCK